MSQDQLNRIEKKVDKLDERLDKVDVHMAKYNSELEFHIARTNQMEDALLPIVEHVKQMQGAIKLALWIVGTAIAIAAIYFSK